MNNIKELQSTIGFVFDNENLLTEALTHRSFLNENKNNGTHNERLEFLGDAVLELVITEMLFLSYPELPEGDLTSFRAALVKTESLAFEAKRMNLGNVMIMSHGEEATGGRTRPYILANAFEAIIGAIYLDKGWTEAYRFIKENIYYKVTEIVENRLDIDPKSKLQELAQDLFKITPTYNLVKEEGPDHNKKFTMAAMIGDYEFGAGEGDSKQNAEQQAAKVSLDNWDELTKKYFNT